MRIPKKYINKIIAVFDKYIQNKKAELRLYGSRTIDTAKGGDIDLLLLSSNYKLISPSKWALLADLKKEIGDQKIDLIVTSPTDTSPFIAAIKPKSIVLNRWQ